jgi:hypothetical protein
MDYDERLKQVNNDIAALKVEKQKLEAEKINSEFRFGIGERAEKGKTKFYLQYEGGRVILVAVDGFGAEWTIVAINPNGKLYKYSFIGSDTRLSLDKNGRINETN